MALQRIDTAFGPNPIRLNGNLQPQANANVWIGNVSYQLQGIYSDQFIGTATFANVAYYLNSGTAINPSSANVAGNIVGYATTVTANVATGAIVSRGGLGVADIAMIGGNLVAASSTVSTSTTTGALVVVGGIGVAGNINVGSSGGNSIVTSGTVDIASNVQAINTTSGALIVDGGLAVSTGNLYIGGSGGNAIVSTGDLYNGGNIWATNATNAGLRTNQTTAYVFNETATTVRIGGAATTLSIGAAGADTLTYQATTGSLIPGANAAVNLGSSTAYWGTTFTGNVVSNAAVIGGGGIISSGSILPGANITQNLGSSTAFYGTTFTGNIVSNAAVIGGGGLVNSGTAIHRGNTQATSTTTGAMQLTGGMSIASGNLFISGSAGTAIVATGNILPSGNVVATNNIGSDTTWWNNFYGVSTQARYADLAENYQADANYEPGTVLEFGGSAEVTIAEDGTKRVAGVVSTNPAHLMNGMLRGPNVVPLALQGRTPCKVRGKIFKGDMLISGGNGYARPDNNPQFGTVIGKALEDFDGIEGLIEVVVGRL